MDAKLFLKQKLNELCEEKVKILNHLVDTKDEDTKRIFEAAYDRNLTRRLYIIKLLEELEG